jgi:hypothetical protein
MATTVTLLQTPSDVNLAYGPNAVTLTGITTGDKYVLQVQTQSGNVLADIRQTANREGNAIFDIQNILQTYVKTNPINIEQHGIGNALILTDSPNETFTYIIKVGDETSGQVELKPVSYGPYLIIGGKKPYYDLLWNESQYQTTVKGDDSMVPCTIPLTAKQPMSDKIDYIMGSDIPPTKSKPSYITNNVRVQKNIVYSDSVQTKSYYNALNQGTPMPSSYARAIEGFRISEYDRFDTLISDLVVPNTVDNGCGPNQTVGEGIIPTGATTIVTMGQGPQNLYEFDFFDANGNADQFNLNPATKYYYIAPVAYTPPSCNTDLPPFTDLATHYVQWYIIEPKECLDYDHIQFSWLNSLGFRDYFTFTKKNQRTVTNKRNEYLQEVSDYNAQTYEVNAGNRGRTAYSQTLEETWTASTGYMSDEEARYLESMFNSADVRVRLGQQAPTGYDLQYFACNLLSASYIEKTYRKDKLFQYEVRFKLANNIKSQRG